MAQIRSKRKIVKPLAKGQITIPGEFRKKLKLNSDTLLSVTLVGGHLEIEPLEKSDTSIRRSTMEEIDKFLREDKIDKKTADRVRAMLDRGEL